MVTWPPVFGVGLRWPSYDPPGITVNRQQIRANQTQLRPVLIIARRTCGTWRGLHGGKSLSQRSQKGRVKWEQMAAYMAKHPVMVTTAESLVPSTTVTRTIVTVLPKSRVLEISKHGSVEGSTYHAHSSILDYGEHHH